MTPIVDGRTHHFESRGLYDGVSVLWDEETGTLWHHITGEAMYGELKGYDLNPVHNLWQTTVEQALDEHPDIEVAISDRTIRRENRWAPLAKRLGLSRMFRNTISAEDERLPTMDVGLGVWIGNEIARYYSMETIMEAGNAVLDDFGGRTTLVYFAPRARALRAIYVDATDIRWDGDDLHLGAGRVLRGSVLYDAEGNRTKFETPLQVFTRWYGFVLTFPDTEIFPVRGGQR